MRTIITALLIVSFATTTGAQTQASVNDTPNVIVIKKNWRKSRYRPGWDATEFPAWRASSGRDDPMNTGPANTDPPPRATGRRRRAPATDGYTYEAKVKNAGPKAIEALGWDYVFTDPVDGQSTHHQSYDRTKIGPGKKKGLIMFNRTPPTRTVRAGVKLIEEVVINYVEYQDGSKWRDRGQVTGDKLQGTWKHSPMTRPL